MRLDIIFTCRLQKRLCFVFSLIFYSHYGAKNSIQFPFQVLKWYKDRIRIQRLSTSFSLTIKPARKYNVLYSLLLQKFKEAHTKGYRVNFNWLWQKARMLHREMTGDSGDEDAQIRKPVIVNFIKRNRIRMREKQRNRKLPKEEYRQREAGPHRPSPVL